MVRKQPAQPTSTPWTGVSSYLHAFLEEENAYIRYLDRVEQNFARKLRFQRPFAVKNLLDHVDVNRFVDAAAQLQAFHRLFHGKLTQLSSMDDKADDNVSLAQTCHQLVNGLSDLLSVVRVVYGQLFCSSDALQATLEQVLMSTGEEDNGDDYCYPMAQREILQRMLDQENVSLEELVTRPLQRFHGMVEFVEALGQVFQSDGTGSSSATSSNSATTHLAPQLLQIAHESRHYIYIVQTEAREERELIQLQKQFVGEKAGPEHRDLSKRKILLHGEVIAAVLSDQVSVSLPTRNEHGGLLSKLYVHCFKNGELVYSKREEQAKPLKQKNASPLRKHHDQRTDHFVIVNTLQLKEDAIFLEFLPDLVAVGNVVSSHSFSLITRNETILFSIEDTVAKQQWIDMISGYLEQNEARSSVLRHERSSDDLELSLEIVQQYNNEKPLMTLPSFHDDDLPGIFWATTNVEETATSSWELVEVVFYAPLLLIFRITGWKQHTLWQYFNTSAPDMEISEKARGDKDWGLVVATGNGDQNKKTIILASKKRSRIDFWYDQVSKAIITAKAVPAPAKDQEKATTEAVAMKQEKKKLKTQTNKSESQPFINARAKPRRRNTILIEDDESLTSEALSPDIMGLPVTSVEKKKAANKVKGGRKRKNDEANMDDHQPKVTATDNVKDTDSNKTEPNPTTKRRKSRSLAESTVQTAKQTLQSGADSSLTQDGKAEGNTSTEKEQVDAAKKPTEDPFAKLRSPEVKTPKHRWLKRKAEDPHNTMLSTTQLSQDVFIDQPSIEVEPSQPTQDSSENIQKTIRIILTSIDLTPAIRKKINAIPGAVYEEDIDKATHVIAPKDQLKRTVKLLVGISRCAHILAEQWLDESARAETPVHERPYCLKDAKAEAKWHFDLMKTMYEFTPAQRQQLFVGHQVFITNHKSILPPVKDLVKIVEAAGGKAELKGLAGPNDIVITSEGALGVASVQKTLTNANPERIYSPELILSSILQQHIEFDKHHLALPSRRMKETSASTSKSRRR